MVQYRRLRIYGGYYFFTVTLKNRKSDLLTKHINILKSAWKTVQRQHPFKTVAYVILPDHFHALWILPDNDDNFSKRIRLIKSYFTKNLNFLDINQPNKRASIWQNRFWEHVIRNEKDYENHFNYIHYNPVKHQLTKRVRDWPYSSFHRHVNEGTLPLNWSDISYFNNIDYEPE